jgi:hypothetical protein
VIDDEEIDQPSEKPIRRGWKRFLVRLSLFFGLFLFGLLIVFWQIGRTGQFKLKEVVQQIDINDQRWKLDEIEADRLAREPPPDQNAARLVLEIDKQIPTSWNAWRKNAEWLNNSFNNFLESPKETQGLRLLQDSTLLVRNHGLTLRERPFGRYTVQFSENSLTTRLPHLDSAAKVLMLLEYDARLAAIDQDPNRGIRAAHAALNVARSIGDEPTFVSQSFRMKFRSRSTIAAMGMLAAGIPTEGLEDLQAAYFADANENLFRFGARGERAAFHRMFERLESGRLDIERLLPKDGDIGTLLTNPMVFQSYKPLLPSDHAELMKLFTSCAEAAKLPWHEQREAIKNVIRVRDSLNELRYPLTRLLFPHVDHILEDSLRSRAQLLVAATAIACERFRQKNGSWPKELTEIPGSILPSVPLNPFDGQLLRYQIFPDRILLTFYDSAKEPSIAEEAKRNFNGAGACEYHYLQTPGFWIAACVWNPTERGLLRQ